MVSLEICNIQRWCVGLTSGFWLTPWVSVPFLHLHNRDIFRWHYWILWWSPMGLCSEIHVKVADFEGARVSKNIGSSNLILKDTHEWCSIWPINCYNNPFHLQYYKNCLSKAHYLPNMAAGDQANSVGNIWQHAANFPAISP